MVNGRVEGLLMSDESDLRPPPFMRQREIVDEVAAGMPARVQGDWVRLELDERWLSMYSEADMTVSYADGTTGSSLPPRGTNDLVEELRKLMYQEGVGTWFSATWTVEKGGDGNIDADVQFNYDSEPAWDDDIQPGLYGMDLEDFPRSEENIPDWLKALLSEAERKETARREAEQQQKK